MQADGNLKSYVAFELYYSQLLDLKLEDLKNPKPQPQPEPAKPSVKTVDLNKMSKNTVKAEEKKDDHAGHNHD